MTPTRVNHVLTRVGYKLLAVVMSYSYEGLEKLAEIVKETRGAMPVRQFARSIGVSHRTIDRLENIEVQVPENGTLEKIARVSGYSLSELLSILKSEEKEESAEGKVAEDAIPIIDLMSDYEASRVVSYIVARFARKFRSQG